VRKGGGEAKAIAHNLEIGFKVIAERRAGGDYLWIKKHGLKPIRGGWGDRGGSAGERPPKGVRGPPGKSRGRGQGFAESREGRKTGGG